MIGKKIDPTKDPRNEIAIKKEGVRTCCKCNKVLDVFPVTSTFYFYPHEGYYCGDCNYIFKVKQLRSNPNEKDSNTIERSSSITRSSERVKPHA